MWDVLPPHRLSLSLYRGSLVGLPVGGGPLLVFARAGSLGADPRQQGKGKVPASWQALLGWAEAYGTARREGDPPYALCLPTGPGGDWVSLLEAIWASVAQTSGRGQGLHLDPWVGTPRLQTAALRYSLQLMANLSTFAEPARNNSSAAGIPCTNGGGDGAAAGREAGCTGSLATLGVAARSFAAGRCALALATAAQLQLKEETLLRAVVAPAPGSEVVWDGAADTLVACDAASCPLGEPAEGAAQQPAQAGETWGRGGPAPPPALINRSPQLSAVSLVGAVNTRSSVLAQLRAYLLLTYLSAAAGAADGDAGAALALALALGPVRASQLSCAAAACAQAVAPAAASTDAGSATEAAGVEERARAAAVMALSGAEAAHPNAGWHPALPDCAALRAALAELAAVAVQCGAGAAAAGAAPASRDCWRQLGAAAAVAQRRVAAACPPAVLLAPYRSALGLDDLGHAHLHALLRPAASGPTHRSLPALLAGAAACGVAMAAVLALALGPRRIRDRALRPLVDWLTRGKGEGAGAAGGGSREGSRGGREAPRWAARAPRPSPDLCLLVTDIQDSTALWEELPAAVVDAALALHHACVRRLLVRHEGYESATEGDSFILAFTRPAHALAFALDAQSGLMLLDWPRQLLGHQACAPVWTTLPAGFPFGRDRGADGALPGPPAAAPTPPRSAPAPRMPRTSDIPPAPTSDAARRPATPLSCPLPRLGAATPRSSHASGSLSLTPSLTDLAAAGATSTHTHTHSGLAAPYGDSTEDLAALPPELLALALARSTARSSSSRPPGPTPPRSLDAPPLAAGPRMLAGLLSPRAGSGCRGSSGAAWLAWGRGSRSSVGVESEDGMGGGRQSPAWRAVWREGPQQLRQRHRPEALTLGEWMRRQAAAGGAGEGEDGAEGVGEGCTLGGGGRGAGAAAARRSSLPSWSGRSNAGLRPAAATRSCVFRGLRVRMGLHAGPAAAARNAASTRVVYSGPAAAAAKHVGDAAHGGMVALSAPALARLVAGGGAAAPRLPPHKVVCAGLYDLSPHGHVSLYLAWPEHLAARMALLPPPRCTPLHGGACLYDAPVRNAALAAVHVPHLGPLAAWDGAAAREALAALWAAAHGAAARCDGYLAAAPPPDGTWAGASSGPVPPSTLVAAFPHALAAARWALAVAAELCAAPRPAALLRHPLCGEERVSLLAAPAAAGRQTTPPATPTSPSSPAAAAAAALRVAQWATQLEARPGDKRGGCRVARRQSRLGMALSTGSGSGPLPPRMAASEPLHKLLIVPPERPALEGAAPPAPPPLAASPFSSSAGMALLGHPAPRAGASRAASRAACSHVMLAVLEAASSDSLPMLLLGPEWEADPSSCAADRHGGLDEADAAGSCTSSAPAAVAAMPEAVGPRRSATCGACTVGPAPAAAPAEEWGAAAASPATQLRSSSPRLLQARCPGGGAPERHRLLPEGPATAPPRRPATMPGLLRPGCYGLPTTSADGAAVAHGFAQPPRAGAPAVRGAARLTAPAPPARPPAPDPPTSPRSSCGCGHEGGVAAGDSAPGMRARGSAPGVRTSFYASQSLPGGREMGGGGGTVPPPRPAPDLALRRALLPRPSPMSGGSPTRLAAPPSPPPPPASRTGSPSAARWTASERGRLSLGVQGLDARSEGGVAHGWRARVLGGGEGAGGVLHGAGAASQGGYADEEGWSVVLRGLRVQAGIHTGPVSWCVPRGTAALTYTGATAALAAKLALRARPGQVLLSQAAAAELEEEEQAAEAEAAEPGDTGLVAWARAAGAAGAGQAGLLSVGDAWGPGPAPGGELHENAAGLELEVEPAGAPAAAAAAAAGGGCARREVAAPAPPRIALARLRPPKDRVFGSAVYVCRFLADVPFGRPLATHAPAPTPDACPSPSPWSRTSCLASHTLLASPPSPPQYAIGRRGTAAAAPPPASPPARPAPSPLHHIQRRLQDVTALMSARFSEDWGPRSPPSPAPRPRTAERMPPPPPPPAMFPGFDSGGAAGAPPARPGRAGSAAGAAPAAAECPRTARACSLPGVGRRWAGGAAVVSPGGWPVGWLGMAAAAPSGAWAEGCMSGPCAAPARGGGGGQGAAPGVPGLGLPRAARRRYGSLQAHMQVEEELEEQEEQEQREEEEAEGAEDEEAEEEDARAGCEGAGGAWGQGPAVPRRIMIALHVDAQPAAQQQLSRPAPPAHAQLPWRAQPAGAGAAPVHAAACAPPPAQPAQQPDAGSVLSGSCGDDAAGSAFDAAPPGMTGIAGAAASPDAGAASASHDMMLTLGMDPWDGRVLSGAAGFVQSLDILLPPAAISAGSARERSGSRSRRGEVRGGLGSRGGSPRAPLSDSRTCIW